MLGTLTWPEFEGALMLLYQILDLWTHEIRISWPEAETASDDVRLLFIQCKSIYRIGRIQGGCKECKASMH